MSVFYYDIVCPYAYMAFYRLHRQNIFSKKNIELKPILLGGLFKLMGQPSDLNAQMSSARAAYIRKDIKRQADLWSVPLTFHERHPLSSLKAMRLLVACDKDRREELSARLYQSYWQQSCPIDDEAFIAKLSQEFPGDLTSAKQDLINNTQEAFEAGVFGVPTMSINNRLYFGADRLELIKDELGLAEAELSWAPSEKIIDFYFDFSSPYSYLAHKEMQKAALAGQKIRHIPILLGALFKELGLHDVPLLRAHGNKSSYFMQDMVDWAQARQAPFSFSTHFPLRTINALRVALVEPQTISAIFAAAWAENLDIAQDEVLARVLDKAGFAGADLMQAIQAPEIKDKLKENTAKALGLGIFGVPSFIIDGQLIFGQDRFLWLKRELLKKSNGIAIGSHNEAY